MSYYHRDEQLSKAFITGGHGEIQNSYQYDAFGVQLEATEFLNNRIRYADQQYDDLTEQYYLRARYYNPVLGRFMQEDAYLGDGLNLYAYCRNNPVIYWDPSGYDSKIPSNESIQKVLDHFYKSSTDSEIFSSNNSWNSFRHVVGGQGYNDKQIAAAYNKLIQNSADGHYIRRNNLSLAEIAQISKEKVIGTAGLTYQQAKDSGKLVDIGHVPGYEYWRTRNAAEGLGWTQAQYDDFMTSNMNKHYRYEEHKHNIDHGDEVKTSDVTDLQKEMLEYQKQQEEEGNWIKEDDKNAQSSCKSRKK